MRKNSQSLLQAIKNNEFIFHLTDIDKSVLDYENELDSYFDELVENKYFKGYKKEYIKNKYNRIYMIKYIVGE